MNFSAKIFLTLLSLIFITTSYLSEDQANTRPIHNSEMLTHNVFFYLNEEVTQEELEDFEAGLEMLLKIPEIYKAEIGVPAETEERDVTDHDFAYSILTHFQTMEDYEIYAEHPDHMKFIEKYSHLWADVKVYDSKIIWTNNN